jgi:hypothetical protein
MDGSTQQEHICTTRCGLVQMYPRYAQKVPCRYRSASAHSVVPALRKLGREARHAWPLWVVSRLAALHSCPQRNLVTFSKPLLLPGRMDASGHIALLARPGLFCMHGRGASLGSIVLLHTRTSTAPHFRQPSGPARRLSQLTLAVCACSAHT